MSDQAMMYTSNVGAKRPFQPSRAVGQAEALGRLASRWWPRGRRDAVRFQWDLTEDEARAVCEGRASKRVLDKILNHDRGGPALALALVGEVFGARFDAFIETESGRLRSEREQIGARGGAVEMALAMWTALGVGGGGGRRRPAAGDREGLPLDS